jgi:hypothetical protein
VQIYIGSQPKKESKMSRPEGNRVARVGWSYPRCYDCAETHWHRNLRHLAKWMLVVTMALMFSTTIVFYAA